MSPALGVKQRNILRLIAESKRQKWYELCGWYWDTHSGTRRVCESLVKRGLLVKCGEGREAEYTLAQAGRDTLDSYYK